MQGRTYGDDRMASPASSFRHGEGTAHHATGSLPKGDKSTHSPVSTPSSVPLGHDQGERRANPDMISEPDLQSVLDEIAARSRRLRLKQPIDDRASAASIAEGAQPYGRPVAEAVDRLLDQFAHFEALLGEDPRLDHVRFSLLTLDSCIARLNYRHIDIGQSPGIEAIISRIEAELHALDQQIRQESETAGDGASVGDGQFDEKLHRLSEAIVGLSEKVDRLATGQEQIATQTAHFGTLKNSVAAISAATLDQVGRQMATIDIRIGTIDHAFDRLSQQIASLYSRLTEADARQDTSIERDQEALSDELKSHLETLHNSMTKSGQQNFAAMSAVLAGTERILERVSLVEDTVKSEFKRQETSGERPYSRAYPPVQTAAADVGGALDPRPMIRAARAAIARAREEAGQMLDGSQRNNPPGAFSHPLGI